MNGNYRLNHAGTDLLVILPHVGKDIQHDYFLGDGYMYTFTDHSHVHLLRGQS